MTANIQGQISQIIEYRNRATELQNLIQGYQLCARSEGKSPKMIKITTTAITTLRDFLKAKGFSTNVTE